MARFKPVIICGTIAICAAVLADFLAPDTLIKLNVMSRSLTHENDLVRESALLELFLARVAILVAAAVVFALSLFWLPITRSRAYSRLMSPEFRYPESYEAFLPRWGGAEAMAMAGLVVLVLVYLGTGNALFEETVLVALNREDGVIETVSAAMLLVAAYLAIRVMVRTRKILPRVAWMHGFLGLLFFMMFGEEISWGQRYLGIETPESLREINVQGEINFHNMFGYFFDHLFILAFFCWGCVVPVIDRVSVTGRAVFRFFGLPIPNAGLALSMLVITLLQDALILKVFEPVSKLRVAEVREFLSAAAFVALMLQMRRMLPNGDKTVREGRQSANPAE